MANKFIQDMVMQLSESFGRTAGMIDDNGLIISPNEIAEIDRAISDIQSLCTEPGKHIPFVGYTFLPVDRNPADFIAFVEGEDATAQKYADILAVSLASLRQFYDEKFDRNNFIKNLLSDNVLPNEVLVRAKELHLLYECPRVVMIIRSAPDAKVSPMEVVQSLFPDKSKDFIVSMDESNIALVKELTPDTPPKDVEKIAENIYHMISSEILANVSIGIGSSVDNVRGLAKSYKDAQVALEVGKVFDSDKGIINYENLGIGRLIYQLPTTLCELFLSEIFKKESLDALDAETLHTIQKFFENNLNISEASRQLYVHRNTLVYRLDKVQKLTGLDLRIFDHAIVFKIALMVKKYLDSGSMKL